MSKSYIIKEQRRPSIKTNGRCYVNMVNQLQSPFLERAKRLCTECENFTPLASPISYGICSGPCKSPADCDFFSKAAKYEAEANNETSEKQRRETQD